MDRTEIAKLPQPMEAKTFYVQEPINGWWAFITVCPQIALLQVHSHWGTFSNRWDGVNGDFLRHLAGWRKGYVKEHLRSWADATFMPSNQMQRDNLTTGLDRLMDWIWPLFIEKLKTEMEAAAGTEVTTP